MYEKIELESLTIEVTNRCNLNCKHCFNSGGHEGEMSVDLLKKIIDDAVRYNVKEIALTGGECLMHTQLFEIIELIKEYPHIKFGILTNGLLLNQDIIREVEKISDSYIQISADGSDKETYESIRGEETFEHYMNALELLSKSKIKDKRTRTAVSLMNYKDVQDICTLVCGKGLTPSFLFVVKIGNAVDDWAELELENIKKIHVNK